jgi:hypothetical protein
MAAGLSEPFVESDGGWLDSRAEGRAGGDARVNFGT